MKKERYLKGFMYTAVLILLYMAGSRLFFRQDLTASRIYSLSEASIETVKSLSEPLTINIFFSKDLPAPHNGTEKYLSDLLQEYAIHGGRHFNYRFYPIGGDRQNDPESRRNADLASSYGIRPMNIQVLESDEVKFKTAYMGLVIIHGDLMERLPAITTIENLEYDLTMAMMKLSNKISTLLALDGKIEADFYLSNSLAKVAPYMGLKDVGTLATRVEETLSRISRKNYDRIFYKRFAPLTDDEKRALSGVKGMVQLKWPPLKGKDGLQITSGSAVIGMVLRYGKHSTSIPILKVSKNPLFGNQYTLMSMDQLEEAVSGAIESLIDINEKVGYLTSNGAPPRFDRSGNPLSPPTSSLNNFSTNLAQSYSVKEVDLAKDEIPENLNSLIIAGPTEAFSDHQLFQIDQALMSGKNVAIFVDAFKEIPNPNKQMAFMQPTIFTPVETNLKKLLNHYGVHVKSAYIMDEKCYKQALPRRFGGGQQTLYYIPIIENEKINHELPFLRQIKGLVTLKASPVTLDEKRIQSQNLKAETLFSTSDRSWTQSRNITLNTMTIRPPADESAFSSQPVAVMVQGEFTSYFADKTIPEKPSNPSESGSDKGKEKSQVSQSGAILTKGRPARLVVVGSVDMLTNSLFDEKAQSPNGAFIMNLMDATAGRESIAVMRGKKQRFNPLKKIPESVKMPIKVFNYAGLPLFTALFGLGVYLRRHRRRKAIQAMFIEPTMPKLSCEESSTLAG